jgi:hypothetical protein
MTFLLNGINIINNIYTVINTLLYLWIGSSIAAIVIFLFNDEKTISFAAMPCMLLVVGLITSGLIPRPLGRKAGGAGDLFPRIRKVSRKNLQYPALQGGDSLFLNIYPARL